MKHNQSTSAKDLHLVILATALCISFVLFSPLNETSVRIILGIPLVLFLPGYSLIAALFPKKNDLDVIERVALSFGISIAITSLLGLALNYTSWGIRLLPVVIALSGFIISVSILAYSRRLKIPERESFLFDFREKYEIAKSELFEAPPKLKIVSSISFILIALSLIIVSNSQATGYELSIYTSTSPLVWIFLILSIAGDERSNWWIIGFFILMFSNFVILSLHACKFRPKIVHFSGYDFLHSLKDFSLSSFIFSNYRFFP